MSDEINDPGDGNHTPQRPSELGHVDVPAELEAEVQSAFADVLAIPDNELFEVAEALHSFLDGFATKEQHDERMRELGDAHPSSNEEAADLLRIWCDETLRVLRARLLSIDMDSAGVWVYHNRFRGFVQWRLDHEEILHR